MTAAAVAVSGIIGWVGLLIPHAARLLVGPDFGRLLPLAMLLGAAFLLAVDTLCRTIATIEVPPGVLTALIGTPFFLWLFALARQELVMLAVESPGFRLPGPHRRARRELRARGRRSDVRARPERRRQDHAVPHGARACSPGTTARIRLDGQEIETLSRTEIARRVGYVPQGHIGYFAFTVREFVLMGRTAHLGIFSAPGRKISPVAEPRARIARHCAPRRPAGHRDLGRRAPARAGGARARAGAEAAGARRAHREPRLRQPGARAAAHLGARRLRHLDPVLQPRPGPRLPVRAPRAAARRGPRARDRRAARGDPRRHARAHVRRLGAR